MDTLPAFIVLHTLGLCEDGEITVGESVVINPAYISGMFPAEAADDSGATRECTMLAVIGVSNPVHVIESPQDICDLILAVNGMGRPADPSEASLFMPYEAVVRDDNPWEGR